MSAVPAPGGAPLVRRRILHVTDCYSTGVGRAVDTVVSLTPEHEHHLLWAGEDDPDGKGFVTTAELLDGHPARVRAVREAVRATGCDVVHAHSSRAGVYVRVTPLPVEVVYQPHAYKLLDEELPPPARWAIGAVERVLGRRTDRVVVLSSQEERLAARLAPRATTTLLPNAPSLATSRRMSLAVARPASAMPRERSVVMSGRVSRQKDPVYLARVADRLRVLDPSVQVRWLGSPDDTRLAGELEHAGVVVTGWLDAAGLEAELTRAGVYLHTARYEGFPLSVLDAAWCAAPVLVRDIAAFTGTPLMRVGHPDDAATRVLELLDDSARQGAALAAGRDLLATMNRDTQRERLLDLYAPRR